MIIPSILKSDNKKRKAKPDNENIREVKFSNEEQKIFSVDDMDKPNMTYAKGHIFNYKAYERELFKSRVNCLNKNITQTEADNIAYEKLNTGVLQKPSRKSNTVKRLNLETDIESAPKHDISGLPDSLITSTARMQYNIYIKPNLKKYMAPNFDSPQELMELLTIKPSVIEELKDKPDFLDRITLEHFNKNEFCTTESVLRAIIKAEAKKECTQIADKLNKNPYLMHTLEYKKLTMNLNKAKHTHNFFRSFDFEYINTAVKKHGWSDE